VAANQTTQFACNKSHCLQSRDGNTEFFGKLDFFVENQFETGFGFGGLYRNLNFKPR